MEEAIVGKRASMQGLTTEEEEVVRGDPVEKESERGFWWLLEEIE